MAIRVIMRKNFQNVSWRSGHIYKFKYQAWQNDPEPVIILMYALGGIHPTSGHEWRFFQGINFTYIPRAQRRQFAAAWVREWEATGGSFQFTYDRVKREFPYLQGAIRRYFYKPAYYIQNPIEVPLEDMEDVIVSTWSRDFSKKLRTNLIQKFRKTRKNIQAGMESGIFKSRR